MRVYRFPIPASFFGMVLGLAGLGQGWRVATRLWAAPAAIGEAVLLLAGIVWATLIVLYAGKWLYAREAARAEANHEIQSGFVALVPLTTMLMAAALAPYAHGLAVAMWVTGTIAQLAWGAECHARVWRGGRDPLSATTVLYLPTVGVNFVSAFVGGMLGFPQWGAVFFGIGLLAWLSLESVLLQRHSIGTALPLPLRATLGIQLAPPVVGALGYLAITTGPVDLPLQILFGYGLFQGLVLLRLVPFFRGPGFTPGLWAFTFGVTAIATVAMRMTERGDTGPASVLALPLFAFANLFVGALAVLTAQLALRGRLVPRPA
ncbi:dicarboxylate transporter/tellurite-resistance protein TehA [Ramlibacter humi]|uniref:Dicarboxylate transporter/tellurite-resistance protein TehA n=1 Tax=Ramlibacter humi TaxID=2530451 RepID=A0A4Z0BHR1_9BURK|nr:dicarboxylate transporter/tellurite-resistance protein TehA [Ramlibacter humi]TFY98330.1 dicarboxylate transporter/tellurite-resistance protein TehA [Ramlibacter humi]